MNPANLMQWILTELWTSRHTQSSWPPSTIVTLGRRLIECRFTMGLRDEAIHLAEDMAYNLRRVWGPLDKTTLEITDLLAEMYTATNQETKAMNVHEEILNWIVSDERDEDSVPADEEASIAARHMDLLKHAFARNNGFPAEKDQSTYVELFKALDGQVGKEALWQNATKQGGVQSVDKWVPMSKGFKEDGVGMWQGVDSKDGLGWCFMSDSESKRKHVNAMRRTSARLNGNWTNGENMWHSTTVKAT